MSSAVSASVPSAAGRLLEISPDDQRDRGRARRPTRARRDERLYELAAKTVSVLYWPVVALVGMALLTAFFHLFLPRDTSWRRDVPGAVFAVLVWLVGGVALRVYAGWSIDARSVFGPLSSPVVLLLWFTSAVSPFSSASS